MYRATVVTRHGVRLLSSFRQPQNQISTGIIRPGSSTHFFSSSGGGGGGGEQKEKFPMPDKDKELKLAQIQTTITDHYKRGDFQKALHASQELLKQTDAHFGREHPVTASAFNNIGLMQKLLGDFTEARKNYNQAMRIYGKVVGRDHASYAMTLHNIGALNKSQVHFDTSLKATERLSLVETALEHLEEAWAIRKAELGDEHPLTVASKSGYGSTLAVQVLYQHKYVERGGKDGRQKPHYVSLNPQSVTEQGWVAAEQHLRQAVETAIANPRGKSIRKSKKTKIKTGGKNSIETLSAAAAAQNLAVFLKSRAMTEDPHNQEMMDEAKKLYTEVQKVRSQLLPKQHPDLFSTKHSLAELLEVTGDSEAANALRQEIIDSYDPEDEVQSLEGPLSEPKETEERTAKATRVIVEKTSASSKS